MDSRTTPLLMVVLMLLAGCTSVDPSTSARTEEWTFTWVDANSEAASKQNGSMVPTGFEATLGGALTRAPTDLIGVSYEGKDTSASRVTFTPAYETWGRNREDGTVRAIIEHCPLASHESETTIGEEDAGRCIDFSRVIFPMWSLRGPGQLSVFLDAQVPITVGENRITVNASIKSDGEVRTTPNGSPSMLGIVSYTRSGGRTIQPCSPLLGTQIHMAEDRGAVRTCRSETIEFEPSEPLSPPPTTKEPALRGSAENLMQERYWHGLPVKEGSWPDAFPVEDALNAATAQDPGFNAFMQQSEQPLIPRSTEFRLQVGSTEAGGQTVTESHRWHMVLQRGQEAWDITVTREQPAAGPPKDSLDEATEVEPRDIPRNLTRPQGTTLGDARAAIESLLGVEVTSANFRIVQEAELSAPHRLVHLSWGEPADSFSVVPSARITADHGRLLEVIDRPEAVQDLVFRD